MKKPASLWLLAVAALIILAVLVIRPPAWATPIDAVQRAIHLVSEAETPFPSNVAHQASPSVSYSTRHEDEYGHDFVFNLSSSSLRLTSDLRGSLDKTGPSSLVADTPNSDNCIACHTDKKKLKAVAEEPEEVKSEKTSGEG